MDILVNVKAFHKHVFFIETSNGSQSREGIADVRVDRRSGDTFKSFNFSCRGNVKKSKNQNKDCKEETRNDEKSIRVRIYTENA